jgi:hypothetical protein
VTTAPENLRAAWREAQLALWRDGVNTSLKLLPCGGCGGPVRVSVKRTSDRNVYCRDACFPPPEVAATEVPDEDAPRAARAFASAARKTGWDAWITHARGTWQGQSERVIDSYAVRCVRSGRRVVAIWHVNEEGKASFALGLDGFRKTGVTDLKSIVKG